MNKSKQIIGILEYFREIGINEINPGKCQPPGLSAADLSAIPVSAQTEPGSVLLASDPGLEMSAKIILPPATASLFEAWPAGKSEETLEVIREDLGDCQRCKLAPLRQNIVFGSGNPRAALMFVGEAPGADEDEQGLPFVGRAGQLLTKIIEAIQMKREDVYICNVLKCRPPNNRAPERDEIESCEPFLLRQVQSIQPKVIVCLGSPAMQTLLKIKTGITQVRGQWLDYHGVKLMATFHPAYCLRWPEKKREVWEDMKKVRDFLRFAGALK